MMFFEEQKRWIIRQFTFQPFNSVAVPNKLGAKVNEGLHQRLQKRKGKERFRVVKNSADRKTKIADLHHPRVESLNLRQG